MTGNFALAVVDRTDVKPDTVSNIVSTLLLTSDLKGHIESPLSYLQDSLQFFLCPGFADDDTRLAEIQHTGGIERQRNQQHCPL